MAVTDRMTPEGEKFFAALRELQELECYAGFQAGKKTAKKRQGKKVVDSEVDLLDVAAFNELGTSRAPSRPFMRQSVDDHEREIVAFCEAKIRALCSGRTSAEQILKELAVFQKGLIQQTIVDGSFAPNAPSTVRKKGSSQPLIDTAHMRQSVMTIIDRKGRK